MSRNLPLPTRSSHICYARRPVGVRYICGLLKDHTGEHVAFQSVEYVPANEIARWT